MQLTNDEYVYQLLPNLPDVSGLFVVSGAFCVSNLPDVSVASMDSQSVECHSLKATQLRNKYNLYYSVTLMTISHIVI